MFRAMKPDADGLPTVARSARALGVRTEGTTRDIAVREDRIVEPRTGGMSVALGAAHNLPMHRLPRSLGGDGRDPVFTMPSSALPAELTVRPAPGPHAVVEPAITCLLSEFEFSG